MKKIVIAALLFTCWFKVFAQSIENNNYPEIGKSMPDYVLRNINQYGKTAITSADLKGQFVILDFWNKYCISCVASFPHTNELYAKYKDKVNIFVVGNQDEGIETLYERFKKKQDLKMPAAFDSALFKRFVHDRVPLIIMVDDSGIVKAVTYQVNEKMMEAFLKKEPFEFKDFSYKASEEEAFSYDASKPFLIDGNGGKSTDFLYRSLLSKYKPGAPMVSFELTLDKICRDDWPYKGRLEGNKPLKELYTIAYLGRYSWAMKDQPFYNEYYNRIILEVKDRSPFSPNYANGENIYWYSLIVPPSKATPAYFKEVMQRDLQNYFGYNVMVETRILPYWRITATEKVKKNLATKGGKPLYKMDNSFIGLQNIPLQKYLQALFYIVEQTQIPIIDETGITGNIDVKVDVLLTDFEEIKKLLRKQGFNIEKVEKEFKVIVISDKN